MPVNKPTGPTSHDIVGMVKKELGAAKAGHLGTLDPMAEGVLLICLDGATKLAPFISEQDKEYEGTLMLGVQTDTWDAEGKVTATSDPSNIDREDVEKVLMSMRGEMEMEAPIYSAIKSGGKPLYKKARRGEKVKPPVRKACVHEMELLDYNSPRAVIRCVVSHGTYVRSIAVEAGKRLGVGAHLEKLRRTRSGCFRVENSVSLEDIKSEGGRGLVGEKLVSLKDALFDMIELSIDNEVVSRVSNGGFVYIEDIDTGKARVKSGKKDKLAKAVDRNGNLVAVMENIEENGREFAWKPVRVWKHEGK